MQRVLDGKENPRAARRKHRDVAREVSGVASSLVGSDQDGLSLNALLSEPAGFEIAGQKMGQGHIPRGHLIADPERHHAIGQRDQLAEAIKVEECDQLVAEGIGKAWLKRDGLFKPDKRLLAAAKPPERAHDPFQGVILPGLKMQQPQEMLGV